MRFTISAATLNNVASRLRSVVSHNSPKVILHNVAIEAETTHVRFSATDLYSQMDIDVPVIPEQVGATTVSARILASLAKALHPECMVAVTHEADKDRLELSAGHTNYELVVLPIADFPRYDETVFEKTFTVAPATLHRLFERSRYAISLDETRRNLHGVYLTCEEGEQPLLVAVGLDGYQMAIVEAEATEGVLGMPGSIIPQKLVEEFSRVSRDGSDIEIALSESMIQFKTESMCFLSRLIDGFYPEYRRLIPTEADFRAEFEARDLIDALKRVTAISKDQNCGVNLTLSPGTMKLEVLTTGQGRADDEIPLIFNHEEFKVRYGVRNLLNVLELMTDSQVTLRLRRNEGASVILDSKDPRTHHVIMPVRL